MTLFSHSTTSDSSLQTQINNLVENMKLGAMINNLKSSQLRKLCRPLGIQQKRNGITLSTQLMRAEIQRQVKHNPQQVIQAIQERLPEIEEWGLSIPESNLA